MAGFFINPCFKHIHSYEEAHNLWMERECYSKRHAKRLASLDDEHEEPHALDGVKKHFSLRLMSLEDKRTLYTKASMGDHVGKYESFELRHYAFRYYSTDCVVYREDDTIFVSSGGYGTTSTNIFIARLMPANVKVHFASSNSTSATPWSCSLLVLDDPTSKHNYWHSPIEGRRIYRLARSSVALTRLPDGSYAPINPEASTTPWERLFVDRARARAILRATRYHDFMAWASVYTQMKKIEYDLDRSQNHTDGWPDAERWRTMLDRGFVGHAHGGKGETGWECILGIKTFHPTYPSRGYGNLNHFESMRV